jgi:hypothetical protein
MSRSEIKKLADDEIIGTSPLGWPYATTDKDEAISRLKDVHGKDA